MIETRKIFGLLTVLLLLANNVDAYRILTVFPAPSYSHFALGNRLAKALAEKGHDVTMIAPHAEKNPPKTYRQISVKEIVQMTEGK